MFFFQLPNIPEWRISRKNSLALERVFKETVTRKGTFSDEDVEIYKEALRRPGALTATINYYRANVVRLMSRGTAAKQAKPPSRIGVPTLFIFGEQDFAILPATVRGVGNYIDAPYREVRIADSGHWVQNEAAAEVNAALLDFLGSN